MMTWMLCLGQCFSIQVIGIEGMSYIHAPGYLDKYWEKLDTFFNHTHTSSIPCASSEDTGKLWCGQEGCRQQIWDLNPNLSITASYHCFLYYYIYWSIGKV